MRLRRNDNGTFPFGITYLAAAHQSDKPVREGSHGLRPTDRVVWPLRRLLGGSEPCRRNQRGDSVESSFDLIHEILYGQIAFN